MTEKPKVNYSILYIFYPKNNRFAYPFFLCGSLRLDVDISEATHVYVSSLCFPESLIFDVSMKLKEVPVSPWNLGGFQGLLTIGFP